MTLGLVLPVAGRRAAAPPQPADYARSTQRSRPTQLAPQQPIGTQAGVSEFPAALPYPFQLTPALGFVG